jgi:hypothetical protein
VNLLPPIPRPAVLAFAELQGWQTAVEDLESDTYVSLVGNPDFIVIARGRESSPLDPKPFYAVTNRGLYLEHETASGSWRKPAVSTVQFVAREEIAEFDTDLFIADQFDLTDGRRIIVAMRDGLLQMITSGPQRVSASVPLKLLANSLGFAFEQNPNRYN